MFSKYFLRNKSLTISCIRLKEYQYLNELLKDEK